MGSSASSKQICATAKNYISEKLEDSDDDSTSCISSSGSDATEFDDRSWRSPRSPPVFSPAVSQNKNKNRLWRSFLCAHNTIFKMTITINVVPRLPAVALA